MTCNSPRLLVSVRDAAEAREALAGGADWIDLKEPRRGALGAVDAAVARDVADAVAGRTPISAAAGELLDWSGSAAERLLDVSGVSLFKLGLAGCESLDWRPRWRAAQAQIAAAGKQLVAVIYADSAAAAAPPPTDVLASAIDAGCNWLLWDTFDKTSGPIDQRLDRATLTAMLAEARAAGQQTVVAGRLDESAISRLPLGHIDMIAVRGAACRGSRDSSVCRRRVAALRVVLARHDDCSAAAQR
jgi:(5-formylfuran-3-yl)methyl phosphate synthase